MHDKKVVKKSFFIKMRQKLGVNHIKSIIKWKITSSEAISFKHFAITVNLLRCWASGLCPYNRVYAISLLSDARDVGLCRSNSVIEKIRLQ